MKKLFNGLFSMKKKNMEQQKNKMKKEDRTDKFAAFAAVAVATAVGVGDIFFKIGCKISIFFYDKGW